MHKRLYLHNNAVINQLLLYIKKDKDFEKATKIMKENQLTLDSLAKQTFKLNQNELAKLADILIKTK